MGEQANERMGEEANGRDCEWARRRMGDSQSRNLAYSPVRLRSINHDDAQLLVDLFYHLRLM